MPRPKVKTTAQVKNDYARKAYDDLRIQVKKGRKADLQDHAANRGESLNGFVNRAIDEAVERDKEKDGDS
ncbi:MAG: antitoxin [Lachnospiraceae bacterium]|nr:antitoxin [Lachnospiraceae bacterium]